MVRKVQGLKKMKNKMNKDKASEIKKLIIEDLRDYMTSAGILFPSRLQLSISKRINIIYTLGTKVK